MNKRTDLQNNYERKIDKLKNQIQQVEMQRANLNHIENDYM